MMKKGYVFVILFSIIIATLQSLKYRIFIKKEKIKKYVKPSQKLIDSAKKYGINIVG